MNILLAFQKYLCLFLVGVLFPIVWNDPEQYPRIRWICLIAIMIPIFTVGIYLGKVL